MLKNALKRLSKLALIGLMALPGNALADDKGILSDKEQGSNLIQSAGNVAGFAGDRKLQGAQNQNDAQSRLMEVPLVFPQDARVFVLPITISTDDNSERTLPVILDTGAAATVFAQLALDELALTPTGTQYIQQANGAVLTLTRYRLKQLKIADCILTDIEIHASAEVTVTLLGLDILTPLMPLSLTPSHLAFRCPNPPNANG